jgi:hypothetical protein
MKLAKATLLLILASATGWSQFNAGEQKPEPVGGEFQFNRIVLTR